MSSLRTLRRRNLLNAVHVRFGIVEPAEFRIYSFKFRPETKVTTCFRVLKSGFSTSPLREAIEVVENWNRENEVSLVTSESTGGDFLRFMKKKGFNTAIYSLKTEQQDG